MLGDFSNKINLSQVASETGRRKRRGKIKVGLFLPQSTLYRYITNLAAILPRLVMGRQLIYDRKNCLDINRALAPYCFSLALLVRLTHRPERLLRIYCNSWIKKVNMKHFLVSVLHKVESHT